MTIHQCLQEVVENQSTQSIVTYWKKFHILLQYSYCRYLVAHLQLFAHNIFLSQATDRDGELNDLTYSIVSDSSNMGHFVIEK